LSAHSPVETVEALPVLGEKKRALERRIRAREFVFGIQDGLISTVGLLSGVSAATRSRSVVLLTGIAAAVTGGISMAVGSYLSTLTERDIFEKELLDQERLARNEPHLAQEALLETLAAEGLDRPSAYRVVKMLATRQDLLLRTVQEKVLGLGSADLSQPLKASLVMFLSFAIGSVLPLVPHLLASGRTALLVSWAVSILTLAGVGVFKGRLTSKPLLSSGLLFAGVALGSAIVGWLLGELFARFGAVI
jgi:VIT1/CCC1 family predicted Fe2+/Mn2+ transporter